MTDWFHELSQWFQERETLAAWIAGTSLFTLVASAIAVPIVVRRIPSDYFLEKGEETEKPGRGGVSRRDGDGGAWVAARGRGRAATKMVPRSREPATRSIINI